MVCRLGIGLHSTATTTYGRRHYRSGCLCRNHQWLFSRLQGGYTNSTGRCGAVGVTGTLSDRFGVVVGAEMGLMAVFESAQRLALLMRAAGPCQPQ